MHSLFHERYKTDKFVSNRYNSTRLVEDTPILGVQELFYRMVQSGKVDALNSRQSSFHGDRNLAISLMETATPSPKYMSQGELYEEGKKLEEKLSLRDKKLKEKEEKIKELKRNEEIDRLVNERIKERESSKTE